MSALSYRIAEFKPRFMWTKLGAMFVTH